MIEGDAPVLLNEATKQDLNEVLTPAQIARLFDSFLLDLLRAPEEFRHAVETDEPDLARRSAHRLKGAALCMGADAVATLASLIERAPPGELMSLSSKLIEVAGATRAICRRLLTEDQPEATATGSANRRRRACGHGV